MANKFGADILIQAQDPKLAASLLCPAARLRDY